jgi:hypothetical protein
VVERTFIVCTGSKEIQQLERESSELRDLIPQSSELRDLIPRGSMLIAERHVTDGCAAGWSRRDRESHTDSRGRSVQPCISGGRFGVHGLTLLAMPASRLLGLRVSSHLKRRHSGRVGEPELGTEHWQLETGLRTATQKLDWSCTDLQPGCKLTQPQADDDNFGAASSCVRVGSQTLDPAGAAGPLSMPGFHVF